MGGQTKAISSSPKLCFERQKHAPHSILTSFKQPNLGLEVAASELSREIFPASRAALDSINHRGF